MERHPLASWLPSVVLVVLALAALGWLLALLAPVAKALVVGASLALLTYRALFIPIAIPMRRWWPWVATREQVAAITTLVVLGGSLVGTFIVLLWSALGGLRLTAGAVWGVLVRDQKQIHTVIDGLCERTGEILRLYPALPWTTADVRGWLDQLFGQTDIGGSVLRALVTGGGGLALETILAAVVAYALYVRGATLGTRILELLPLDQRGPLVERLHERSLVLVQVVFVRAVVTGLLTGLVAWAIGSFPFALVAAVAVLASVMPLLGPVFVWLPLSSLLAGQGHWWQAIVLAVLVQGIAYTVSWRFDRRGRINDRALVAVGPLLLLTLVGGVWTFGAHGLVLAPAAVVLAITAWDAFRSLSRETPENDEPLGAGGHA